MKASTVINCLAGLALSGIALSSIPHFSRETIEVKVESVKEGLVMTDKGNFENTWSAWEWKFSPYELKEGHRYVIGVYGCEESWLFGDKRNIINAQEITEYGF